ncbi:unnamed protein product [Amoebophrya sp. A120]|nr:unnamed protein product [Amoebophrya sp. A120]|eukprot:GSA120T00006562001.1
MTLASAARNTSPDTHSAGLWAVITSADSPALSHQARTSALSGKSSPSTAQVLPVPLVAGAPTSTVDAARAASPRHHEPTSNRAGRNVPFCGPLLTVVVFFLVLPEIPDSAPGATELGTVPVIVGRRYISVLYLLLIGIVLVATGYAMSRRALRGPHISPWLSPSRLLAEQQNRRQPWMYLHELQRWRITSFQLQPRPKARTWYSRLRHFLKPCWKPVTDWAKKQGGILRTNSQGSLSDLRRLQLRPLVDKLARKFPGKSALVTAKEALTKSPTTRKHDSKRTNESFGDVVPTASESSLPKASTVGHSRAARTSPKLRKSAARRKIQQKKEGALRPRQRLVQRKHGIERHRFARLYDILDSSTPVAKSGNKSSDIVSRSRTAQEALRLQPLPVTTLVTIAVLHTRLLFALVVLSAGAAHFSSRKRSGFTVEDVAESVSSLRSSLAASAVVYTLGVFTAQRLAAIYLPDPESPRAHHTWKKQAGAATSSPAARGRSHSAAAHPPVCARFVSSVWRAAKHFLLGLYGPITGVFLRPKEEPAPLPPRASSQVITRFRNVAPLALGYVCLDVPLLLLVLVLFVLSSAAVAAIGLFCSGAAVLGIRRHLFLHALPELYHGTFYAVRLVYQEQKSIAAARWNHINRSRIAATKLG